MTREVMALLQPEQGGVFVDCTVGMGGHARAMLEAGATQVIGLDRDPAALAIAAETLSAFGDRVELVHSDYRAIASVLDARGIDRVDGTLDRHGHVVVSARSRRAGVQLSARRSARHADGHDQRPDGRGSAARRGGVGDRRRDLPVRRGAILAPHRARRSSRRAQQAPLETTTQLAAIVRRAVPRRGFIANRSGDAHVSGAAHLGEPRAREHRRLPGTAVRAARRRARGWS